MPTIDMSEQLKFPVTLIYDPGNDQLGGAISGSSTEFSLIVRAPTVLHFFILNAATVLTVQARLAFGANVDWADVEADIAALAAPDVEHISVFTKPFNFVRVERVSGTDNPVIFAQFDNERIS